MDSMFRGAMSFTRKLCGSAWVHSQARKTVMFEGSSGSISRTVCTTTTSAFSPQSKEELKDAIAAYLKLSPKGECTDCVHGPIAKWDVSRVKDMSGMFQNAKAFSGDISKWKVSSVTDMSAMFEGAKAFNGDISKWDVSSVSNFDYVFLGATLFKQKLCGSAWVDSKATNFDMFRRSSGSILRTMCTATSAAFTPQSK